VVQRKLKRETTAKTSLKNLKTEVIIDRNCGNISQTKDFSKRKCLSRLHNSNSSLKKELV